MFSFSPTQESFGVNISHMFFLSSAATSMKWIDAKMKVSIPPVKIIIVSCLFIIPFRVSHFAVSV